MSKFNFVICKFTAFWGTVLLTSSLIITACGKSEKIDTDGQDDIKEEKDAGGKLNAEMIEEVLMRKKFLRLVSCVITFSAIISFGTPVLAGPASDARNRQSSRGSGYQNNSGYGSYYGNGNNYSYDDDGGYPTDSNGYIDWTGDYYSGSKVYVIAGSDSELLDKESVKYLSDEVLRLALNEIYARHGRKFKDSELQAFFNNKEWYTPLYEPAEFDKKQDSILNETEKKNISVLAAERSRRSKK